MTSDTILVTGDPPDPGGGTRAFTPRVMPVSYAGLAARLPAVRTALAVLATPP